MTTPDSFEISIDQSHLDRLLGKVSAFPWQEMPEVAGTADPSNDLAWAWGTPKSYMREVADYWTGTYDWRKAEEVLNRYPHFKAKVDGIDIHYVHAKAKEPRGLPLVITHGWPGSFYEFYGVVDALNEAGHDVILPSLIGYGFSGPPKSPLSPRSIARHFAKLLEEHIGLDAYIAQGGDWGSVVTGWLGWEAEACKAIHLNMLGWMSPGVAPETEEEKAHAAATGAQFEAEGAYFRLQSSKPQSLNFAMMDSPVGLAAWMIEKFRGWSHVPDGNLEAVFSKDQMLTNIMIYLVTESFGTSTWVYNGLFTDPSGDPVPAGARIEKPVGIARYKGDDVYAIPPRSQVEKSVNVVHWSDFDCGGHFAAFAEPALFAEDLIAFAKHAQELL